MFSKYHIDGRNNHASQAGELEKIELLHSGTATGRNGDLTTSWSLTVDCKSHKEIGDLGLVGIFEECLMTIVVSPRNLVTLDVIIERYEWWGNESLGNSIKSDFLVAIN